MPGYGTHAPHIQAVDNSDPSAVRAPIPKNFFAIVYSAAFLLSLGGGFLSGKTSYIIVNLFADQNCVGVKSDQCNDALNKYTEASAVTTFTSLGFALVVVPFLTRASDAFGRRIFIQVILHSALSLFVAAVASTLHLPAELTSHAAFAGRLRHGLLERQYCLVRIHRMEELSLSRFRTELRCIAISHWHRICVVYFRCLSLSRQIHSAGQEGCLVCFRKLRRPCNKLRAF